jgi:hypothetical protein
LEKFISIFPTHRFVVSNTRSKNRSQLNPRLSSGPRPRQGAFKMIKRTRTSSSVKLHSGGPVTGRIHVGRREEVVFTRGLVIFHTIPGALRLMHQLHKRASDSTWSSKTGGARGLEPVQAGILHERAVGCALATLQVSSRPARIGLCNSIFDFVRSSRSVDGLESMVLSAIVAVKDDEPRLAEAGLALWRQTAPAAPKSRRRSLPIIDVNSARISFLTPAQISSLTQDVSVAGNIGSYLPGLGDNASANDSNQDWLVAWTVASALIGGAASAAATSDGARYSKGLIIGLGPRGFVLRLGSGGQGGGSLGQAICTNTSPGVPSGMNDVLFGGEASPSEDRGYDAGFAAGWAQALGGTSDSSERPWAQLSRGFADGYATAQGVANLLDTPMVVTNSDGSITTTLPDGTQTTVSPDGNDTTTISSIDGTMTMPDGSITTTTIDGTITTTTPDGTTTTTTPDGTTTTTTPDGLITSITIEDTTSYPDAEQDLLGPGYGSGSSVHAGPGRAVIADAFASGGGLERLITSVTIGDLSTYFVAGLPQIGAGGGLTSAGILAGVSR